jgi:hypothetical protein
MDATFTTVAAWGEEEAARKREGARAWERKYLRQGNISWRRVRTLKRA